MFQCLFLSNMVNFRRIFCIFANGRALNYPCIMYVTILFSLPYLIPTYPSFHPLLSSELRTYFQSAVLQTSNLSQPSHSLFILIHTSVAWVGMMGLGKNYTTMQTSNSWSPHLLCPSVTLCVCAQCLLLFSKIGIATLTLSSFNYNSWMFCVIATRLVQWKDCRSPCGLSGNNENKRMRRLSMKIE